MAARDPEHWLYRFTPREWIRAGLADLARAERALSLGDRRGGLAGCRRAAGMALNGVLCLGDTPDVRYGRTYMEHLAGLAQDGEAPEAAREAARALVQTPLPGGEVVSLRTASSDAKLLEATRTVMAHALALVMKSEPGESESSG